MKSPGKCEEQQRVSVHWSQEAKKSKSIRAKLSFTCIVLVFATLNRRTMQVLARITYLASFLHARPPDETKKTQLFDNLCTSRSKKRKNKKKNPVCLKSAKVPSQRELAWVAHARKAVQRRGKLRVTFAFPTDPSAREGRANKLVQECGCDTGN